MPGMNITAKEREMLCKIENILRIKKSDIFEDDGKIVYTEYRYSKNNGQRHVETVEVGEDIIDELWALVERIDQTNKEVKGRVYKWRKEHPDARRKKAK